jgi:hypothetical protein
VNVRILIGSIAAILLCASAGAEDWTEVKRLVESPHPYAVNTSPTITIRAEGATAIRVHFEKLDLEDDYDFIDVLDKRGRVVETMTGKRLDFWTRTVAGDRLTLRLRSDEAMVFWGYRVDRYAFARAPSAPPPPPAVKPATLARLKCMPVLPVAWEGGSTALEILGYDGHGRPLPPESLDLFWNVLGEGAVIRTPVAGRFEYRAPASIDADRIVRLRVYDAQRPEVNADVRVQVRNRATVTGLALLVRQTELEVGQTLNLGIEGRTSKPDGRPALSGWPIRVWLEGPGRLEPMRGVGLYRYVADAGLDIRRPTRVIIRSALVESPKIAAMTVLTVYPRTNLVGLKVSLNRNIVEPGEQVEVRVDAVGDQGKRPVQLLDRDIALTATVGGSDRPVGNLRNAKRAGPLHWIWRAPDRITHPMEITIRAAVGEISGNAKLEVVHPISSLVLVPAKGRLLTGESAELRIEGRTGKPREVFEMRPSEVKLTVDGPGRIRPGKGKELPRYEAPRTVAQPTSVTVRVALLRKPDITGAVTIMVSPDVRIVRIDVRCAKKRLAPGEETEISLTPKMSHAKAPVAKDVTLTARSGSLRRVRPGVWSFKAPTNVAGRRELILRAVARDDRGRATDTAVPLLVETPGTPADAPIDTDHLFEITEWTGGLSSHVDGAGQAMPKNGIFKPRSGTTIFRAQLLKRVRSIHIEMTREGKDEVKRFDLGGEYLTLKRDPRRGQRFTFKREFGHPGKRYTVRVYATMADGAVYRGVFLVVPKK